MHTPRGRREGTASSSGLARIPLRCFISVILVFIARPSSLLSLLYGRVYKHNVLRTVDRDLSALSLRRFHALALAAGEGEGQEIRMSL